MSPLHRPDRSLCKARQAEGVVPAMRLNTREEVGLISKARRQGNFNQGKVGRREQLLRVVDAPALNVFVRAKSGRPPELGRKMHAAEAGDLGKIGERDRTGQARCNIIDHTPEAP